VAYAQAHARELGIDYIIWYQRIWSVARADEGWRRMEDRGSATANHLDHPHINVLPLPRRLHLTEDSYGRCKRERVT
jgi:hypothetical protein